MHGNIYQQKDGLATGSALGSVLPGILVVKLDMRIIPTVTDSVSHWRSYVHDTFVFIKKGCIGNA